MTKNLKLCLILPVLVVVWLFGLAFVLTIFMAAMSKQACPYLGHLNPCQDNTDANPWIHGDSQNSIQTFLGVIHNKGVFALTGDTTAQTDGCRKNADKYKHRKGRWYHDLMWTIDCWEPLECTMLDYKTKDYSFLKLIPLTVPSTNPNKVHTVLLPLDEHETSSYTFLPLTTEANIMFVTSMLSGCSVFIARPYNTNCNLIAIHTNYRCNDPSTSVDFNHLQAMAVLEEIQQTNPQCRYQIDRRWAADYWRHAIEAAGYHYRNRVVYYDLNDGWSFLYGYHVDPPNTSWQFCIRVSEPNPPPERCYAV